MNAYMKWTFIGLMICIRGFFAGGVTISHGEPLAMVGGQTLTADDFIAEMKVAMSTGMTRAIDQPCHVDAKKGEGWPK